MQGYEIAVVGESQNTARYAGINVKKVIIRTMMLSGAICGIAGCLIVSGASHTISTSTAGGRGFTAIIVAWMSKFNPFAMILVSAFLATLIVSALGGLIYSFLTITLRANQNVVGLALTTFGVGFGNFFGGSISKLAGGVGQISVQTTAAAFRAKIPGLSAIPVIGDLLFSYGFLTYLSVILAVCMTYFLKKTRRSLNLRAVGESPATADAAGINVSKYKYIATVTGAAIAGLGGLYILYIYLPGLTRATQELCKMLPYVVTIIVLVITSKRNKQENQPPASLGEAYFREDR